MNLRSRFRHCVVYKVEVEVEVVVEVVVHYPPGSAFCSLPRWLTEEARFAAYQGQDLRSAFSDFLQVGSEKRV